MPGPLMESELPVEPQSLKKLSFKSLKRALDLFSPTHGQFPPPDTESKKIRVSHKLNTEYARVRNVSTEHAAQAAKSQAQQAPIPSNALALPGPQQSNDLQKGGPQKDLIISSTGQPRGPTDVGGQGRSTTIVPSHVSSERMSTSAIMERIPSRWPRPVWHAPWKNYRVISGHLQKGVVETVLCVFREMMELLYDKLSVSTMVSVLSACGNGRCLRFGRQLHGIIVKVGLEFDTNVGTGLVDMYSKCGYWQHAYSVFRDMGRNSNRITWNSMIAGMMLNDQCGNAIDLFVELESEGGLKADSATWNSMISGFFQLGKADVAFRLFRKMLSCGVTPSVQCITSLLAACSSLSVQSYGKQLHAYAARTEIIDDEFLATAIIDMYMKCGDPALACNVFNQFHIKPNDPAFWNAMISGYGKHGQSEAAFDIFNQMVDQNVKPNLVTLSCLLSVCSHSGHVYKGFQFFRIFTVGYGFNPTPKHMRILIDLLSRSGRLDEAFELLQATNETSVTLSASLLNSSDHYLDSKLSEEMSKRLLELEPENPIPFVVLSNIYARQDRWKDVHKIRKLMDKKGLKKLPGLSSVVTA